ncbi:MAG: patatin-like phospholipase family protein [Nibricoccus sp.]
MDHRKHTAPVVQPRPDSLEDAYPRALRAAEAERISIRRAQNQINPNAPLVGVALSGGGIRSATFCVGVFQALARLKLVRRIDFLSTVSGGGYFGSFLGASFSRENASADEVEHELSDNNSWSVDWLRENGRFLSPNGAGDGWIAAAVMLRNWVALHLVMLTFAFLLFGFGVLLRAELSTSLMTLHAWTQVERFLWQHRVLGIWWSPWMVLPAIPFAFLMLPGGVGYWLTQCTPLMKAIRSCAGLFSKKVAAYSDREFVTHAQNRLTSILVVGFIPAVILLIFGVVDSLGQTAYWKWANTNFTFPTMWAGLTGAGFALYGFASKIYVFVENLLGKGRLKITFNAVALAAALTWILLIIIGVSVAACSLAWNTEAVESGGRIQLMSNPWALSLAVTAALLLSCVFSRSFAFVNLSSLQQVYAARLRRAYIGATNPERRASANYSMTDLIVGDDFCMDEYRPESRGGPLHVVNVTVNETLSAKSQIQRCDRKGLAMAIGPAGLSVGTTSHALWADDASKKKQNLVGALFEDPTRPIRPINRHEEAPFTALQSDAKNPPPPEHSVHHAPAVVQHVEALSLGRWVSISGAAFTTGLGSSTHLGLSLLLGLANVRLGYWWDGGIPPSDRTVKPPPSFLELVGRLFNFVLPVQTCLVNEIFARFHGPARRYWYLSDGGHFENTACYELIRRRVPFIVCTDCGADPQYQFADLANLVRKARTDFGAEIEIIRRARNADKKEPGHRLPSLEQLVHPSVVDMFGAPEDFPALNEEASPDYSQTTATRRHALLARIRYFDTDEICWLLLIKPSLGGDEPVDVIQYQRTQPSFPQEPTSDQYFDEAQWESYRKLGEHIATALFSTPEDQDPRWSPSRFSAPTIAVAEDSSPIASQSIAQTSREAVGSAVNGRI